MAFPIRAPRVNNNDDIVRLSAVLVEQGSRVRPGDPILEVETDKATFGVEAEREGYFLKCLFSVGETVEIGSVLAWMGEGPEDLVPSSGTPASTPSNCRVQEPTLRAALLLAQYGLTAADVPATADRLRAEDVEGYVSAKKLSPKSSKNESPANVFPGPDADARVEPLSVVERGMLRTVAWHRDEAVPGYVEVAYDPGPWEKYASRFQSEHRMLLSPLLGLLAYRLIELTRRNPKLNATIHDGKKLLYQHANVGFTVQSSEALYLGVLHSAEGLTEKEFVQKLAELQKQAMKNRLDASRTVGATIGFTSMARWNVVRHQPVLAPYTSFMVAHSAPANGVAALGATYDHRLLTGGDAVSALTFLKDPPEASDL